MKANNVGGRCLGSSDCTSANCKSGKCVGNVELKKNS
jgi:hypothetical protein